MSDTPKQPNEGNAWVIPLTKHGALIEGKTYQPGSKPQGKPLIVTNNIASSLLNANRLEPFTFHNFIVKTPDPWVDENGDPRQDSPPDDYGSDLITIQDEEKLVYTFYVDGVSWDDSALWRSDSTEEEKQACLDARDTSGDGTKEKPWKNLSYVLDILDCLLDRSCCYFFRVVVSGTVDYTFARWGGTGARSAFYGKNRVVFDFQTPIDIKRESTQQSRTLAYGVYNILNSYFYNCTIIADAYTGTDTGADFYAYGFYSGYNYSSSYFYNCTISASSSEGPSASADAYGVRRSEYAYGIHSSGYSYFYNCIISASSSTIYDNAAANGISGSDYSYFYNCTISARSEGPFADANGISGSDYSYFYNCTISADADAYGTYSAPTYGISGSNYSYFYNCTISASISYSSDSDIADAHGIYSSWHSYFYNCTISASSSGGYSADAYGIYRPGYSYFYNCTISASSSDDYSAYAYGISYASNSYFYNCTISARSSASSDRDANAKAGAYGTYYHYNRSTGYFNPGSYSYFYNCTISASSSTSYDRSNAGVYGVYYYYYDSRVVGGDIDPDTACNYYFYNCTINADADAGASADVYGVYYNEYHNHNITLGKYYFYNCPISASSSAISDYVSKHPFAGTYRVFADAAVYGIYSSGYNSSSYFYNCTISADAGAYAVAGGTYDADIYAEADANAYGIYVVRSYASSYFYNCTISADADADTDGADGEDVTGIACPSNILLDPSNNVIGSCKCIGWTNCEQKCEDCAY